jgi:hypothetical protein
LASAITSRTHYAGVVVSTGALWVPGLRILRRIGKMMNDRLIHIPNVQAAVPSISRNIPALHVAIPLLRHENVRLFYTFLARCISQNSKSFFSRLPNSEAPSLENIDQRYELTVAKSDNWGEKAKRRKTIGTGRMRYLKLLPRLFKNGFRTGVPKGARGPGQASES